MGLEKEINDLSGQLSGDSRWTTWVTRINDSFSGFRSALTSQLVSSLVID